jgi:cleavage and polyadenylation specificity factor subunit 1
VIYQPFHYPNQKQNYFQNLRWLKLSQPKVSQPTDAENDYGNAINKRPALTIIENIGGYSTVAGSWPSPFFILKEASNLPKVINIGDDTIKSIAPFHTATCDQGFISVDSNVSNKV